MIRVLFTTVNGNPGFRTLGVNARIDEGATHLFREQRADGTWVTRGRKLTGTGPWAAANYMRAVHTRGGRIELLGTL